MFKYLKIFWNPSHLLHYCCKYYCYQFCIQSYNWFYTILQSIWYCIATNWLNKISELIKQTSNRKLNLLFSTFLLVLLRVKLTLCRFDSFSWSICTKFNRYLFFCNEIYTFSLLCNFSLRQFKLDSWYNQ